MRPERTKRPRTAADGTVLSAVPPAKRARTTAAASLPRKAAERTVAAPVSSDEGDLSEASEEEVLTPRKPQAPAAPTSVLASLAAPTLEEHMPGARHRVLSVLAGQLPPPGVDEHGRMDGSECVGLQDQWLNLRATVRGTLNGEGNSALLVGARGSGKSLLLESVLRSVEGEGGGRPYHLVQLDGAIQPTDRLSMRELARQLVRKGAIKMPKEGEEGALDLGLDGVGGEDEDEDVALEPPIDGGEDDDEDDEERQAVTNAVLSSLANTTSTILTLLSTGANAKKSLPLIITLSSFDLYTSRPRQALLYVLLDAVQAGSYTPGLCVVGMTSRLDTTDLLEKRVRSRFGGRTINVWPEDMWVDVMKRTLLAGSCGEDTPAGKDFDEAWASEVETLCSDKKVLALLDDCKAISNDVCTLHRTLFPLVAAISPSEPSLLASFHDHQRSPSYSVLSDLTVPEFALLIASKQLHNRDREVFNFEMCFDELKRFVAKMEMDRLGAVASGPGSRRGATATTGTGLGMQALTDRRRVMMAFRALLELELFQPEATLNTLSMGAAPTTTQRGGAQTVRSEYLRVKCTIFPQDIINAARAKNRKEALGTHMVQWATSQG